MDFASSCIWTKTHSILSLADSCFVMYVLCVPLELFPSVGQLIFSHFSRVNGLSNLAYPCLCTIDCLYHTRLCVLAVYWFTWLFLVISVVLQSRELASINTSIVIYWNHKRRYGKPFHSRSITGPNKTAKWKIETLPTEIFFKRNCIAPQWGQRWATTTETSAGVRAETPTWPAAKFSWTGPHLASLAFVFHCLSSACHHHFPVYSPPALPTPSKQGLPLLRRSSIIPSFRRSFHPSFIYHLLTRLISHCCWFDNGAVTSICSSASGWVTGKKATVALED